MLSVFAEMHICCMIPVATFVHVMEGFGSPWASQSSLAVLSAATDIVLTCGSAILGLDLTRGAYKGIQKLYKQLNAIIKQYKNAETTSLL